LVRWLWFAEAVDWLKDRESTARPEHTMKFSKRLPLVGNKDKDRAGRDHIDGGVCEGAQVVGGRLKELAAVPYTQIFRQRLIMIQQFCGNIAENHLALLSNQGEGAKGDQTIPRAYIQHDITCGYVSMGQNLIAEALQDYRHGLLLLVIAAVAALEQPLCPLILER
jgi:hypothetical protein